MSKPVQKNIYLEVSGKKPTSVKTAGFYIQACLSLSTLKHQTNTTLLNMLKNVLFFDKTAVSRFD